MNISAHKTDLSEILTFRDLFLEKNKFQIRYNACHERNWSDSYLLTVDDVKAGYGSVKGKEELAERDAIFEFFVIPPFQKMADQLFNKLIANSGVTFIECQSNDKMLSSMQLEFSTNIRSDVILFEDCTTTETKLPSVIFRHHKKNDAIFDHLTEPAGDYVLEKEGEVVATGGFMLHYNLPFADLYMEVKDSCRRQGLGNFLVQELKKVCYGSGRVPAARCNITNIASRATLEKAGLRICGTMQTGDIRKEG